MYRYIIIDDEEVTRKGTLDKLQPMGDRICCVGEAEDGKEGLAMAEELHPNIIITDMKMPVMGGDLLLPILAERYPEIYIIVISGYRDFEYSRQAIRANAIDYLLKPFRSSDIMASMEQAIQKIKSTANTKRQANSSQEYREALCVAADRDKIYALLQNHDAPFQDMVSQKLIRLSHLSSFVLVLLYRTRPLIEEEVVLLLQNHQLDASSLFLPHPQSKNLGYLLLFRPASQKGTLPAFCANILKPLRTQLLSGDTPVLFGISGEHTSLSSLYQAALESVQALNDLPLQNRPDICLYQPNHPAPKALIWEHTDELLFYIEAGDAQKTGELAEDLFCWYPQNPNTTLYEIKYSCLQITTQVKYMLNQYIRQIQPGSVDTSVQNILNAMFDLKELSAYYRQFFCSVATAMAPQTLYSDQDIASNVKTYIDRNYQRNITVEFAASLFHVNRSYLSHIFKKKVGVSFVTYLNQVRIEQSKLLLLKSSKKTYQIAKQVGYNNVSYFWKIFRKLEHMTPEQFREIKPGSHSD